MLRGYVSEYLSCGDNSCTTSDRYVKILDFRHFERFLGLTRVTGKHTKSNFRRSKRVGCIG